MPYATLHFLHRNGLIFVVLCMTEFFLKIDRMPEKGVLGELEGNNH